MEESLLRDLGNELYRALREKKTVSPLTERYPDFTIDDAYHVSKQFFEQRLNDGEKLIGKKIGVTSKAVQDMLNVHQPDFGFLMNAMQYENNCEMPISQHLIQPKAEGEIAFFLNADLVGPGVTNEDVLNATEYVVPCFEIVDSRIQDWKIKIQDTVADNASCGLFLLGEGKVNPRTVNLETCKMTVWKNGEPLSQGLGSAALGSPLNCVSWLANTLGRFDIPLKAGEIVLSGSLVPLEPVVPGDTMRLEIEGIGSASVDFV
jgi:2-oxopent-4-enoate/cis-2-oxohex-4-enoate hydratase